MVSLSFLVALSLAVEPRPSLDLVAITQPTFDHDVREAVGERRIRARTSEATVDLYVSDEVGDPMHRALIYRDGLPVGQTDAHGFLQLRGLEPGERTQIVARHDLGSPAFHVIEEVPQGASRIDLASRWQPGVVRLQVSNEIGQPMAATVDAASEHGLITVAVGTSGTAVFRLPEGGWTFLVTSVGGQTLARQLDVVYDLRGAQLVQLDVIPEGQLPVAWR